MKIYNGYSISNTGKVFNPKGAEVGWTNPKGYRCVTIYFSGTKKNYKVHRLVAMLYKPEEYDADLDVNHLDGNKGNNCISNLEMATRSQNIKHAWDNKLRVHTPSMGRKISERVSKLKEHADEIRRVYAEGNTSSRALGLEYGVDKKTIMSIVHRRYY